MARAFPAVEYEPAISRRRREPIGSSTRRHHLYHGGHVGPPEQAESGRQRSAGSTSPTTRAAGPTRFSSTRPGNPAAARSCC